MPSWSITSHKNICHFPTSDIYLKSFCLFGKDTLNKQPGERAMVLYWLKKADCSLNIIQ